MSICRKQEVWQQLYTPVLNSVKELPDSSLVAKSDKATYHMSPSLTSHNTIVGGDFELQLWYFPQEYQI